MNRSTLLATILLAAPMLAGCPVKPKAGDCHTSADCEAAAGFGGVCVEGKCQECGRDGDCRAGFVCRSWKCLPRPECAADADCGAGKSCQGERCVAPKGSEKGRECAAHVDCGEGRSCDADGRCVSRAPSAEEAACADPAAFAVRFGFDESSLAAEAQGTLQRFADCLRRRPATRVVVTGHCDERGTTEYNLALGGRRAEAVKKYLAGLGVAGGIETVTLGKERPLCTEATDACWARNRRAELMVSR